MARSALDRIKEQYDDLRTDEEKTAFRRWVFDTSYDEEQEARGKAQIAKAIEYKAGAEELRKNWGKIIGLRTQDYWELDNMTGGFVAGELIVISAKTSDGKTMWALNIVASLMRQGHKILFVTLENSKEETLSRLWNILGDEDYDALLDIDILRFQTADKLDAKMLKYIYEVARGWGAELIVIDHLHYLTRMIENQAVGIGLITQEVKALCMQYKIATILICQLRKLPEGRDEPIMDDLYGSVFISQDAEIVMLLHRVRQFDPLTKKNVDTAVIKLWKNRNRGIWKIFSTATYLKKGFRLIPNEYNPAQDIENRNT